jgi:hypothetical protein
VVTLHLPSARDLEALLSAFMGLQLQLDLLGLWQLYPPIDSISSSVLAAPAFGDCGPPPRACHSRELEATRTLPLALKERRARFLAEFTLSTQSEILRFAQDDSEGLEMTA